MKRVTLREVAETLHVSVMTVSLALRDNPRISETMRESVKRCAEKLGYRPDPALSALTSYRHEKRTVRDYRTLAFLTNFQSARGWQNEFYSRKYFEGAEKRARELGYKIEPFWMRQPGLTPRRAQQILEARGIKGLLLAPVHDEQARVSLDWSRFCAVSLCRSLAYPHINVVDHNHTQSMSRVWQELRGRGYARVGYAIREFSENLTGRYWLAAHLMEQQRAAEGGDTCIHALVTNQWNRETFKHWLQENRPDVVISPDAHVFTWLQELGLKIPQDLGFVCLEAEAEGEISGICQDFPNVGIAAVDLLHLELMRAAYGIPSVRQMINIDGFWVEGRTLSDRPARTRSKKKTGKNAGLR